MAQMEWNKYPEVTPPADDRYIVVEEYQTRYGNGPIWVTRTAFFAHNLSDACSEGFDGEERQGWYDVHPDFYHECYTYSEPCVVCWMPFPELPTMERK